MNKAKAINDLVVDASAAILLGELEPFVERMDMVDAALVAEEIQRMSRTLPTLIAICEALNTRLNGEPE
ncbi:MAG TPA: hypothetical protein VMW24_24605 [Sedimentisphaerales bacterium]|nr:hypothetical protein [Sedimentisphaerales bacterium]